MHSPSHGLHHGHPAQHLRHRSLSQVIVRTNYTLLFLVTKRRINNFHVKLGSARCCSSWSAPVQCFVAGFRIHLSGYARVATRIVSALGPIK